MESGGRRRASAPAGRKRLVRETAACRHVAGQGVLGVAPGLELALFSPRHLPLLLCPSLWDGNWPHVS